MHLQRVSAPGHSLAVLVLRRLGGAVVLFWLVLTLTFSLLHLAPGDPAALLVPPDATVEQSAHVRAELGLDRAVPVQAWLGGTSLLLTFLIGVPVGMLQAARRGRPLDHALTVLTTAAYAAPTFWIALALVAVFTYGASSWGLPAALRLPAFGVRSPAGALPGLAGVVDLVRHAVLPIGILSAVGAAGIARYARSSVADVLDQDFVRTARAKGLSTRAVYFRHVLRPVLPPLAVLFALALPGVIAGSVFVESVFAWPGAGRLLLAAIIARDFPVVMGATVV